jgi:hypothetical protein
MKPRLTCWRRNKLGFIFQAFHILPHLTLLQNVVLPLWLQGASGAATDNTAHGKCSLPSASPSAPPVGHMSCLAANCSGWRLPGRWFIARD